MINDVLKQYIKEHNLTQKELAALLSENEVNLSRYLSGSRTPTLKTIKRWCAVLNVPLFSVFKEEKWRFEEILRFLKEVRNDLTDEEKMTLIKVILEK